MGAERIDVLAALGSCRMETSQVAAKCRVTVTVARHALKAAEQAGDVESTLADSRFWRRGAATPLIWRATSAARARIGGAA